MDNTFTMCISRPTLQTTPFSRSYTPKSIRLSLAEQKISWTRLVDQGMTFWSLSGQLDKSAPSDLFVNMSYSCGMDACEHEYESMSRHNRKVPTSFYRRFAQDACNFSETYACGRLVSVLEGGYSDRALISGAMAHLSGLVDHPEVSEQWWSTENLTKVCAYFLR